MIITERHLMKPNRALTRRRFLKRSAAGAHPKSLLDVRIGQGDSVRLVRPQDRPISGFVGCVKAGLATCAPVDVAHRSTNLCAIGAISMRLRRPLRWSADGEEFLDDEQANRLRGRAMRAPWSI